VTPVLHAPAAVFRQSVVRLGLSIIAGALLGGDALADVPDADLEAALRSIAHEVLDASATER
jgi:hypothetical protein